MEDVTDDGLVYCLLSDGSIVWAKEPAPTSDRETTTQRIADVIFGAFAKLDPKRVTAAGNGAMSYFFFAGTDKRTNSPYVYVETIGGGICQVSSTLYNVLLQLPRLTILHRRAHGDNGAPYLYGGFLFYAYREDGSCRADVRTACTFRTAPAPFI